MAKTSRGEAKGQVAAAPLALRTLPPVDRTAPGPEARVAMPCNGRQSAEHQPARAL